MSTNKEDTLSKLVKLNGLNYYEWRDDTKMILIMKGYWRTLNADHPTRSEEEDLDNWLEVQQQCLAVIHLSCERDQKHLISEYETGIDVWDILAEHMLLISNVMRIKELFGRARKSDDQTMPVNITGQESSQSTEGSRSGSKRRQGCK